MRRERPWVLIMIALTCFSACTSEESRNQRAQQATIRAMRIFGTQLLEGRRGWEGADPSEVGFDSTRMGSVVQLDVAAIRRLIPDLQLASLPGDGWGRPLQVWLAQGEGTRRILLRSTGSDGVPDVPVPSDPWESSPMWFSEDEGGRDIIWVQGEFKAYPSRVPEIPEQVRDRILEHLEDGSP